jgi:hypothetical protein
VLLGQQCWSSRAGAANSLVGAELLRDQRSQPHGNHRQSTNVGWRGAQRYPSIAMQPVGRITRQRYPPWWHRRITRSGLCALRTRDWVFLRRFGVRGCIGFRPLGRVPFGKRPKRNQKVLPRTSGFSLRRKIPSLKRSFRGTPRRAIPGPSRLSRHPCRSTPETPLQRGLLNGAFGACGYFSGSLQEPKPKPDRCGVGSS